MTESPTATILGFAHVTGAVIRLVLGSRARSVIAVADLDGRLVALYRIRDATVFSIDVAVAKSRHAFSNSANRTSVDLSRVPMNTAVDNRTIGFGAQPFFPPGADYSTPGPFFNLYKLDAWHACTQRSQPSNPYQNRKEFFLDSLPLYKDGGLGGPGVSGDGVEQDDFVTAAGAVGLEAPPPLRADQIIDLGLRLPYLKSLVIQWTERH